MAATFSGVPATTTVPPPLPPSGPMSMTQSALAMTSRLCSMTTTELPLSTSP